MCPWKWKSANYYIGENMVCVQVFWESSLNSCALHRNEPQLPLSECRDFIGTAERNIYRPASHFNTNELFHWYQYILLLTSLAFLWHALPDKSFIVFLVACPIPTRQIFKTQILPYCWLLPLSPNKFNLPLDRIRQLVALSPSFK